MRHSGALGGKNQASKVIDYLLTVESATTLEIHQATGGLAVSRDISDARELLREAGMDDEIPPAEYVGRSADGAKIFRYRLKREAAKI